MREQVIVIDKNGNTLFSTELENYVGYDYHYIHQLDFEAEWDLYQRIDIIKAEVVEVLEERKADNLAMFDRVIVFENMGLVNQGNSFDTFTVYHKNDITEEYTLTIVCGIDIELYKITQLK